jgi:hypothetical protein
MRAIDKMRRLAEVTKELAHYMTVEDELLRSMYFAGRRGEEIPQDWKDGQRHSAAMVKDYQKEFRALLKWFPR